MKLPPLSEKLKSIQKSQTISLTVRAGKMKEEGIDVINLTAGEPDFATPEHIKEAGINAIKENFTKYTSTKGITELLNVIAKKFKEDNNLQWSPDEILVSCGAKHSLFNALQAICNPGDEIIIPSPYWVSFPEMVKLADALPVIIDTDEESGFKITPDQLNNAMTDKTKGIILNSPSNPTGAVYTFNELKNLSKIIDKQRIYVVSDEIYERILYNEISHIGIGSFDNIRDLVITINGVSKAFSMTGWRIGYAGANQEITTLSEKYQTHLTSNPTSISQKAALTALTSSYDSVTKMVRKFKGRRDLVVNLLNSISSVNCTLPQGAFYAFPNVSNYFGRKVKNKVISNDIDLCEYLLAEGKVATVPGSAFGSNNHLRISFAASDENLRIGMERIAETLEKLQ